MSPRLRVFLAAVFAAAAALLWIHAPQAFDQRWSHYVGWAVICLLSDTLWSATPSGGTWSLSSTAGLATAMLWGPGPTTWIAAVSTLLAELFVLRKPWVRAVFNACQITVTLWAGCAVFTLLGGPAGGIESMGALGAGDQLAARLAVPALGLMATYLAVNRALVSVAVAWSSDRPYLRVLREDWFHAQRLLEDLAAFLMAPLMVVSFLSIQYLGVVLFYAPLRMIYESDRRFVELRNAQNQLIHSERMAAKGEIAAEIGHELNNQLVAIRGRAQMLTREAERKSFENVERHAQIILEQAGRMAALAKGMMDFSRAELEIDRVDMNALVMRTMEFVRTQNRFDGVEWDLRLRSDMPQLRADPGQLQQVLLNLFLNAADAMVEKGAGRRVIGVTSDWDERSRVARVVVTDTGTGIAASNLSRIFEPHFTTKPTGHGFGLSTSYRIVTNHGGRIAVDSPPGQGACFTITLPLHGPGGWG